MLWEYRIMSLPTQKEPREAQEALNSLGDNGRELVSVYPTGIRSITCSRSRSKRRGERKHKAILRRRLLGKQTNRIRLHHHHGLCYCCTGV
jgi:hypothetical protein